MFFKPDIEEWSGRQKVFDTHEGFLVSVMNGDYGDVNIIS